MRHTPWRMLLLAALSLAIAPRGAVAEDRTWPREMNTRLGLLTIYQPQPEKFETNPDEDQSPPKNARAGEE